MLGRFHYGLFTHDAIWRKWNLVMGSSLLQSLMQRHFKRSIQLSHLLILHEQINIQGFGFHANNDNISIIMLVTSWIAN